MNKMFFLSLVVSTNLVSAASGLPTSVGAAHEAYLNCDSQSLFNHVKEALIESKNHPLVVTNTRELMKAAKKNGCLDNVDPGFKLPSEVVFVDLEIQRKYKGEQGKVTFAVNGSIGVKTGSELEVFKVVRYPDQLVLDFAGRYGDQGTWNVDGEDGVWISGFQSIKPVEEGLYLVDIKLKGQERIHGYVIMNDKNSSASPVIIAPNLNQELSGPRPTFTWRTFTSPEKKETEKVKITLSVRPGDSQSNDKDIVWARLKEEKSTSFKVGDHAAARFYEGQSQLKPGSYIFHLNYRETEYLGGIGISRSSGSRIPFTVK